MLGFFIDSAKLILKDSLCHGSHLFDFYFRCIKLFKTIFLLLGTPVTKIPIIGKKTLDVYSLFRSVCERGGIQQVKTKLNFFCSSGLFKFIKIHYFFYEIVI